jgi:RimJ/RimL family protein N-acetyltransferase
VNPEAKLLMLGLAFDHGYGRVKLQADDRNARSKAAIAKLGAQFEGVARRDTLRADGTWRDTAIFSVLVDEWPHVRAGLEARLEPWGDQPVEFHSI